MYWLSVNYYNFHQNVENLSDSLKIIWIFICLCVIITIDCLEMELHNKEEIVLCSMKSTAIHTWVFLWFWGFVLKRLITIKEEHQ